MLGFPSRKNGSDRVFVVVDRFSKMAILEPCKKSITREVTIKILFECIWVNFCLSWTIILDMNNMFLSTIWFILWYLMDTKLTKLTAFHPQIDGQIEVVNRMIVHILRMYNSSHLSAWDESLTYVRY
jgi:hypothetical protein